MLTGEDGSRGRSTSAKMNELITADDLWQKEELRLLGSIEAAVLRLSTDKDTQAKGKEKAEGLDKHVDTLMRQRVADRVAANTAQKEAHSEYKGTADVNFEDIKKRLTEGVNEGQQQFIKDQNAIAKMRSDNEIRSITPTRKNEDAVHKIRTDGAMQLNTDLKNLTLNQQKEMWALEYKQNRERHADQLKADRNRIDSDARKRCIGNETNLMTSLLGAKTGMERGQAMITYRREAALLRKHFTDILAFRFL